MKKVWAIILMYISCFPVSSMYADISSEDATDMHAEIDYLVEEIEDIHKIDEELWHEIEMLQQKMEDVEEKLWRNNFYIRGKYQASDESVHNSGIINSYIQGCGKMGAGAGTLFAYSSLGVFFSAAAFLSILYIQEGSQGVEKLLKETESTQVTHMFERCLLLGLSLGMSKAALDFLST